MAIGGERAEHAHAFLDGDGGAVDVAANDARRVAVTGLCGGGNEEDGDG